MADAPYVKMWEPQCEEENCTAKATHCVVSGPLESCGLCSVHAIELLKAFKAQHETQTAQEFMRQWLKKRSVTVSDD